MNFGSQLLPGGLDYVGPTFLSVSVLNLYLDNNYLAVKYLLLISKAYILPLPEWGQPAARAASLAMARAASPARPPTPRLSQVCSSPPPLPSMFGPSQSSST